MDNLIDVLEKFGCVDLNKTLDRFLNDEEFYYSILLEMVNDPMFDALGKALKENDVHASFEAAHTIKGVVANCGITPMSDLAVAIVEPLRNGKMDGVKENYKKLIALLDQLKKLIQKN